MITGIPSRPTEDPLSSEYSPIPELNLLKEFQDRRKGRFADTFYLLDYGDTSGLEAGNTTDPEALDRLIPFAQANGSGSEYALWRFDDRTDLATLPVVVFGDEGGEFVVTRSLRELFQLLCYDREISVWDDEVEFLDGEFDDEPYERSPRHEEYVAWLAEQFALTPVEDPNAVIEAAQEEFAELFEAWFRPFQDAWQEANVPG